MEFDGDLYTPTDQKTFIFAMIHLDFLNLKLMVKLLNQHIVNG